MKFNVYSKIAFVLLLATQACQVPSYVVEPNQIAQTPQNKIFSNIKKGIVVFKGISCPENKEGEIEEKSFMKNFFTKAKMFREKCNSFNFVNSKDEDYYIKQFSDSASKKTFAKSEYHYYTVPAGRYYYNFEHDGNVSNKQLKKAFYFDVEEGKAFYAGDFVYNSLSRKIKVIDNYYNAKEELHDKLPVSLEKSLAKGSKVIYVNK